MTMPSDRRPIDEVVEVAADGARRLVRRAIAPAVHARQLLGQQRLLDQVRDA